MIIKRYRPPLFSGKTKTKGFVLAVLSLLTMSSVSSVQASYQPSAGKRGSSVTIALDPPTPLRDGDGQALGFAAPLSPNDPAVNLPVPMPDVLNPDIYGAPSLGVPATPPATPNGVPFVLPTSSSAGTPATPYLFATRNPTDSLRSAICLATAIYYEAVSESDDGQRAVAQVILNRVRHPAWPSTVCGVVYQGSDGPVCQFSYACDGAMARRPTAAGWAKASRIAREALAGYVYAPVGLSTFYHTPQVNPSWNKRLIVAHVIGNHIFYRMPGAQGAAPSFNTRYVGGEPMPAPKPKAYRPPAAALASNFGASVPLPSAYPAAPLAPTAAMPVPMPTPVADGRAAGRAAAYAPRPAVVDDNRYVQGTLPESDVMPAYRDSGSWIKR
jgi:Cell Wall Hydrolase